MKTLALVAVAAMGLTACQNEYDDEQIVANDSVVVTFVADAADDTRTSVDTSDKSKPVFAWGDNETFAVLEQTEALAEATSVTFTNEDGKAKIEAEFDTNAGKGSYNYVTIYPESGYKTGATSINEATLSLPAEQTMAEGSYDPAADLMVSEVVTTNAQPTEAKMVGFTRLAAVAKMTLKNLALEAGDAVESVTFTAEGKVLAGTFTTDLAAPAVAEAEGSNSVTVATTSTGDVYFTVLPTTIAVGEKFTVTVVTNRYIYVKEVTIPEGKNPLTFEAGNVTLFSVNMSGVTPSDKWVLVKDASTLKQGDIVTIAAKNHNYAIGAKRATNYPYASETAVIKVEDYLYHPIATAETTDNNKIQQFTLVKRDSEKNAFDFYDKTNKNFLCAPYSGSKYLHIQDYYSANTQFNVSIAENGAASIIATNSAFSSKQMMYNNSTYATSRYFYCYSSITETKYICLYKLEGAQGEVPVVAANVTIPEEDESIVIAEEGATEATAISTELVKFNYVGAWTISASANAEWLNPAYDAVNNCLTYTAEQNTSAEKREATITIKATLEGQKDLTWTVNVTQKGAPLDITIEEFATKGKDVDTVYKLIGIITEIPSSTSGKWKLADENGNTAQVQYLKTEAGAYVKGNVDVKVGDVISLTTVVATTTVGLGGNSSYPAVYKGHYTLEATASGSVDYVGGDVTINVNVKKYGHIDAPTDINSDEIIPDNDLVTGYSFTNNGDGTATAVLSFGENKTGGSRSEVIAYSTTGDKLSVSTEVTVMQDVNPALKKGWWLVTDVNDLKAGDKLIIAATGLDYAISTETNTNTRKSKPITKNGASLQNVADDIQQYALEIDANGLYSFKGTLGTDADKYIYASSSSSNYMKVTSTLDDNGKWTIAIAADGAATVIAQGANTRNHMQYNNKVTSSPAFNCTEDGSLGAVCFYKFYE